MALKWIIGDFRNGAISESNELPVVYNEGDKVEIDVNANESATITVSKNDLPSDWRTYLRPVDRFVALIETDLAWASSVIWAGFINKVEGSVNETLKIQAAGLREYMAPISVSDVYNATNTNPETAVVFQSAHHRGLMANMILKCFSSSGIPSSSPKPPQVLSSVTGSASGTTVSYSVLLSNFETYGNMLDEWRDELSENGNEYRFTPSWSSSSKTAIRWIGEVATSAAPHFNEDSTLNIVLGDNEWKPLRYKQSMSSDNMVSRIIGQSKEGANKTGADYTTKTTTSSTSILLDETWNPGVELTTEQMTSNLTARLNYNSQSFKEAEFSRVYETTAELRTIISQLGSMATFSGSGASQYFGLTMRIVGVSFNPSKKTVEIQLAPKAARYPKLPKDNRGLKKKSETKHYKPKNPNYGNYTRPIVPQPKPGSNGTTDIPGGIPKPPEPVIPPPFTPPVNEKDIYTEEPIAELVDMRWFKSDTVAANDNSTTTIDTFHHYPNTGVSRLDYQNNRYVGLNMQHQLMCSRSRFASDMIVEKNPSEVYNLKVYSMDFNDMFDRTSNLYMDQQSNSTLGADGHLVADDHITEVGTIPYNLYSDLYMDMTTFKNEVPNYDSLRQDKKSPILGGFDYNFFTNESFTEFYVQIMYNINCWINVGISGADLRVYSATFSKVLKGTLNSEGKIESWDNLGQIFTKDSGTDNAKVFFSKNIYQINGEFQTFGGYWIPQAEEDVEMLPKNPTTNVSLAKPWLSTKYTQNFYNINMGSEIVDFPVSYNLPDAQRTYSENSNNTFDRIQIPLAITVDYANEKILLGLSQAQGFQTVFYESAFGSKFNFKKIMDTNRYQEPGMRIGGSTPSKSAMPESNEPFRFTSKAPIIYKDINYIWMLPSGVLDGLEHTGFGPARQESDLKAGNKDKKMFFYRTKEGYKDVVNSTFDLPPRTGNGNNNAMKQCLAIGSANKPLTNNISALNNLLTTTSYPFQYYRPSNGGFDYFEKDGHIYIICDTRLSLPINTAYDSQGRMIPGDVEQRLLYWVAKIKIDDSKL